VSTTVTEVPASSDPELIASVRGGYADAYRALYQRHVAAASRLARQLAGSAEEAEDLVAEAFARVLDALRAGRGPDAAFRAYLLTALRHVAYDKSRRDRRVSLTADVSSVAGAGATSVPFRDVPLARLERSLAARAFARLPERWQAVLWHTEIEGQLPAEVAPLLGLTQNGVSALAHRAREGLRQAYLQAHLAQAPTERCRLIANRLGAWTRSGLSRREAAQVANHLDRCTPCRAMADELADVNGTLRAVVAPLVLGAAAAGYLAPNQATVPPPDPPAAGTAGPVPDTMGRHLLRLLACAAAMAAATTGGLTSDTGRNAGPSVGVDGPLEPAPTVLAPAAVPPVPGVAPPSGMAGPVPPNEAARTRLGRVKPWAHGVNPYVTFPSDGTKPRRGTRATPAPRMPG
jgi:RNA polymerase sigma factor (sigma-70 family)